ncbi:amino acid ABC transporter permease [Microvirga sp. VF16]|uniref:amino acid ABC transporter permease n=1 Tax=Microvirga sp. VF16 TaxID=2807101 RepID=UPI00193D2309|nr:amino acid ABC transporter permease [Microvirga sp. VF16]QRM32896.1 amino acid ABC transporter permease [Microvirga sp. VF16]
MTKPPRARTRLSPFNLALSALALIVIVLVGTKLANWAVINAVWGSGADASERCRDARGVGACWALIGQKYRFLLFSSYPYAEQWRPAVACAILLALVLATTVRRFWTPRLALAWAVGGGLSVALLRGGFAELPAVAADQWGGLAITLILALSVAAFSLPWGVALALGRQSSGYPIISRACIAYVEFIRSIPLVSLFFMGIVLFPILIPSELGLGQVGRALIILTIFYGAYVAEAVRGNLQSLDAGQAEAAISLGLGYWTRTLLVILPQVLRASVPALVGTFIGLVKDTSLVFLLGVFDILNTAKLATVDPLWQAYSVEALLFAAALYFFICASISAIGGKAETQQAR